MRILIVEDDDVLVQILSQNLMSQRYTIDVAADGESGWDYIQMLTYDLILLDIDLPRLDGIALCKRLRYHRHKEPVLLLTARSQISHRVQGLDAGADDYLVKPYALDELLARIRALLRRQTIRSGDDFLSWGPLRCDPQLCQLTVEEQALALSPKEYQLMELFLRHPQQVLSSDRILDHIWGFEDTPGKDTVRTHMRRLRKKLKPLGADHWIETVYGLGYRLKSKDSNPEDCSKRVPPSRESYRPSQSEIPPPPASVPAPSPEQHNATLPQRLAPVPSIEAARQASLSLWSKFRPQAIERLTLLKTAIASLERVVMYPPQPKLQRIREPETLALSNMQTWPLPMNKHLHRQGERAAHKLVGTLGMFGMPEGSELASQIETLFQQLYPPLPPERERVMSLVHQLQLKCASLQHRLGLEDTQRMLEGDDPIGLLSYPQARRDLSKYFCLARRHHHAIALAWVTWKPAQNSTTLPIPQQWLESAKPVLNSFLVRWALSVKQSLRAEDIVTQCSDDMVLLVLYSCSKDNAISRLKPCLNQFSTLITEQGHECVEGIDPSQNVIPFSLVLSAQLAEFPQDGQTFDSLEKVALQSNTYYG